jgi:hypothetical protein
VRRFEPLGMRYLRIDTLQLHRCWERGQLMGSAGQGRGKQGRAITSESPSAASASYSPPATPTLPSTKYAPIRPCRPGMWGMGQPTVPDSMFSKPPARWRSTHCTVESPSSSPFVRGFASIAGFGFRSVRTCNRERGKKLAGRTGGRAGEGRREGAADSERRARLLWNTVFPPYPLVGIPTPLNPHHSQRS